MVSMEQQGPSVKACKSLAHGDCALAEIDKREIKSNNRSSFRYAISIEVHIVGHPP